MSFELILSFELSLNSMDETTMEVCYLVNNVHVYVPPSCNP